MRSRSRVDAGRADAGSVTAEFAATLPAVAFVLAASVACLQVSGEQLRLQDAAADAARILARGEAVTEASAVLARAVEGATFEIENKGALMCLHASAPSTAAAGLLSGLVVAASACALGGGR